MAGYLGYLKNRVETSLLPRACPPVPAQVLNSATAGVSFTLMQERSRRSTGQLVGRSCPRPFQAKYDSMVLAAINGSQSVIISGVNFSFQNSRPTSQSYITLRPWSVVSPLVFTGHLHSQSTRYDGRDSIRILPPARGLRLSRPANSRLQSPKSRYARWTSPDTYVHSK